MQICEYMYEINLIRVPIAQLDGDVSTIFPNIQALSEDSFAAVQNQQIFLMTSTHCSKIVNTCYNMTISL